jgi:ATP-binding cassette subfamily B protein
MFGFCFQLSWKASKFYTVVRMGIQIITSFIQIASTYVGKMLIDLLTGNGIVDNMHASILFVLLIMLVFGIGNQLIKKLSDYCTGIHNSIFSNYLERIFMERALCADLQFFDSPEFYNKFQNARMNSQAVVSVIWNIINAISSLVTLFTTFILVSQMNLLFGVILVVAVLPSTVAERKYTEILYRWDLGHVKEQRQMSYISRLASDREHAQDIRLFHIGDELKSRYIRIWNLYFKARKTLLKKRTLISLAFTLLPEICMISMLAVVAFSVADGQRTIGDFTLYQGLLGQLSSAVYMMVIYVISIYDNKLRIDNVREFLKVEKTVRDDGTKELKKVESIEFRNVSFVYPGTEKKVLDELSFHITGTEKLAVVGINGAGKTTLIKLMLRFYDPSEGEIRINDRPICEYTLLSLHRCFSSFFQNASNYAFTLRENITISDLDQEEDDNLIEKALEFSDASNLLDSLSKGLDTSLTRAFEEDGVELSGGQHQKIALARTFYRNSCVILLDEPSSALDPEAEYYVFQKLEKLCENKMAVFTSHRLSNVFMADKIVLIENGRVMEYGTHDELIQKNGRYAQLFHYQADKFVQH